MKIISGIFSIAILLVISQLLLQRAVNEELQSQISSQSKKIDSLLEIKDEIDSLKKIVTSEKSFSSPSNQESTLKQISPNKSADSSEVISLANFSPTGSHKDDPYLGEKDSAVTIMAFLDYQCGPCRSFVKDTLPKLRENFIEGKNVKFLLRDFPLGSHPQAIPAASFAHCAGEQGSYWNAFNLLYDEKSYKEIEMENFSSLASKLEGVNQKRLAKCMRSERYLGEIMNDKAEGKAVGAVGAPGFFIGKRLRGEEFRGVFIRGAQPYSVFAQQLKRIEQITHSKDS